MMIRTNEHDPFKKQYQIFRNSCSVYDREKDQIRELEQRYPAFLTANDETDFPADTDARRDYEVYRLMKEDIKQTDRILDIIYRDGGPSNVVLIRQLYFQGKAQTTVAEEMGLSRRQLQYRVDNMLRDAFLEVYQNNQTI